MSHESSAPSLGVPVTVDSFALLAVRTCAAGRHRALVVAQLDARDVLIGGLLVLEEPAFELRSLSDRLDEAIGYLVGDRDVSSIRVAYAVVNPDLEGNPIVRVVLSTFHRVQGA
jgi:hypothetical protein